MVGYLYSWLGLGRQPVLTKQEEIPAANGMLCAAFSKFQCCRDHSHSKYGSCRVNGNLIDLQLLKEQGI